MSSEPIVFDWDDTLLCTTWLVENGVDIYAQNALTQDVTTALESLCVSVCELLHDALARGRVFIITNAGQGWIEQSCLAFMPNLYPMLFDITLISARGDWETAHCTSPTQWKIRAFDKLHNYGKIANIISFGDSECERTALWTLCPQKVSHRKNIKLQAKPSAWLLNEQLKHLLDMLGFYISYCEDMDIELVLTSSIATCVDCEN